LGFLALSTSIAGLLEAAVMLYLLQQKLGQLQLRKLAQFSARVLVASLAMGLGLLILRWPLDAILVTTHDPRLSVLGTFFALFKLAIELIVGFLIYVWATRKLGIQEFWKQGPVRRVLQRLKLSWI
jgi:putative peptidoglycan lipid II flippase